MKSAAGKNSDLKREIERLKQELDEASMTLDAIRTGQVDALLVESDSGPQLYTLNSADQAYRFFIEEMSEGAVTLDPEGLILFCNRQFASLVDLPVSMVLGKKLSGFILPEELPRYVEIESVAWKGTTRAEFCVKQSARWVPVQFSITPLDFDGYVTLSVLVTDLTNQKSIENVLKESNDKLTQLNLALEASNHDLQQFASVASHDLQEPVRKIQIFSGMLRDHESQLSPTGTIYLEKVISSADRMRMLIVDILNYSGLSADEEHLSLVSLPELIRSLLEDFELIIQDQKAVIKIDPLPDITANAGQIRQVFQNLLSNALKFSRPGVRPEINIRCRRVASLAFDSPENESGAFWLLTLSDNGIGFEERYAEKIFSLFKRLNGKDKFAGTGIGLAIAKKIIDKHGGIIRAQGAPNQGSAFSFILPGNH